MTVQKELAWKRTQVRVPREDGTFLIQPEPAAIATQLDQSRETNSQTTQSECQILNRPLTEFRDAARNEITTAAVTWTSDLLDSQIEPAGVGPLIMTGHQPELLHPGVFAKNVATSVLACRPGRTGLNLVVDNDLMGATRVRVPVGSRDNPGIATIDFDEARSPLPWEEARVRNLALLESFGDRVAHSLAHWDIEPMITEFWPAVVQKARHALDAGQHASLVECMTAGRAMLERSRGLGNLELPISKLCETNAFRAFAAHVMLNAGKFCQVYNQVLTEYRKVHHIRSTSHPVPELQIENGWCETPFWIWRADDPRRGRLFVRQTGRVLELATAPNSAANVFSLTLNPDTDASEASATMSQLQAAGLRLRTRALTTTLFSRLCLCDLFVHGIGGAKYDAMTDQIAARFFGVRLPGYLTLSATVWLPIAEPHAETTADAARLRQMLRELQQNPQRHFSDQIPDDAVQLVNEKNNLIAEQHSKDAAGTTSSGQQRYRRFPEINKALAIHTQDQQYLIRQELESVEQRLAANRIITSREFSYCLHPARTMDGMIRNLKKQIATTD